MRIPSMLLLCAGLALCGSALAEPYLAVASGQKCMACHVSPSGGGKRTEFGNAYAQTSLSQRMVDDFWDGNIGARVSVGGDLRANLDARLIPNQNDDVAFDLQEGLAYVELRLLEDRLSLYVDQRFAPGGSSNREAYGLLWFRDKSMYLKAGRMFLPYGWRLEDDSAFIRQVTGINYNTPDDGVEAGWESGPTSLRLAVTNGTAGGGETNVGKQYSLLASYARERWWLGGSFNFNEVGDDDRRMQNVFAGLRTGRISWLAEADYIVDDGTITGRRNQWLGLLEANAMLRKGHNLKFTWEYFDPDSDVSEDQRRRASIVWEYFPLQYTQFRMGYRWNDGIPQNDLQNAQEIFLQLHAYF